MNALRKTIFFGILALAAAQCGSQPSCNGQCYSTTYNSCPTDQVTSKAVLCPLNYLACNGACYSPSQYHCANGGLQAGAASNTPAPAPTSSTQTPTPSTSSTPTPATSASSTACQVMFSQLACRTASENSANYDPNSISGARGWLCATYPKYCANIGQWSACNNVEQLSWAMNQYYTDFGPSQGAQACSFGGIGQVVQVNAPSTINPVVTQATTSSAAAAAATTSSSSSSSQTCNTNGCGNLCNCNGGCYNPAQYNCAVDSVTGKNVLCSGTMGACNNACYDTTQYSCSNGAIVQGASQTPNNGAAKATTSSTPASTTATPAPVVNPTPAPAQYPTQTADLRIINSCKTTLWFEARYGGAGAPLPGQSVTAQQALPGTYIDYTVPDTGLSGTRFWAKYGCNSAGQNCVVGDQMQYWPNPPGGCPTNGCTPPVDSLFEATWGCRPGTSCNAGNPTTWFDTSQVDGWTIPYKVTPVGDTSGCDCGSTGCGFTGIDASTLDLSRCPHNENLDTSSQTSALVAGVNVSLGAVDLRIIQNNQVVGCMSPCKRLNWGTPYGLQQPESSGSALWMCCPTPTPSACSPSNGCVSPTACKAGPISSTQYVAAVHSMAPGVYSFSYDDGVGLHACPAGVTKYTMEFCPAGSAQFPLQL